MSSFAKASVFTGASILVKILVGLIVAKLMAIEFGPEGIGLAGNYRQLITVLGVLAGAGIFNGVTKYIAEYEKTDDTITQKKLLKTASAYVLVFSISLGILFWFGATSISLFLFNDPSFSEVIKILAVLQFTIAYSNLILAILKGYRDALNNALAIIIGALIAFIGFFILQKSFGFSGALIGLALLPAASFLPALYALHRYHGLNLRDFIPSWDKVIALNLSKFTGMTVITATTMPLAYYLLRGHIAAYYGYELFAISKVSFVVSEPLMSELGRHIGEAIQFSYKPFAMYQVGIWQGMSMISDAYLQFITATFTVYLLPTFSRVTNDRQLFNTVLKYLAIVMLVVTLMSLTVWLLKDFVIWLLFSQAFTPMRELFSWQLVGDIFKVGGYVFGYVIIAKARLGLYFLAELSQFFLLVVFSFIAIATYGVLGASMAYMMTYMVYFILCLLAMGYWLFKLKTCRPEKPLNKA